MKKIHTFSIVEDEGVFATEQIYPDIHMEIPSEASLEDMLYAFERFLQATGYVLPENCVLDFVNEQTRYSYDLEGEE
jgi:hypothetical protein